MNKKFYKSKTLWGLGIVAVIVLAQTFGVDIATNDIAEVVKILSGLFGAYGLRDALK